MKIYVASHDRWEACAAASVLSNAGHTITSRWHGKEFLQTSEHTVEERIAIATEDYEDVAAADALVLIAGPDRYPGGKFVETGIALGMGKRVVVIGRRENMLIWLPAIQQVDDPQAAADLLSAALSQPAAAVVGEPDGWKLVPIEPTVEMLAAAADYSMRQNNAVCGDGYYRVMVAAAPPQRSLEANHE